jgi:hypothetical protein
MTFISVTYGIFLLLLLGLYWIIPGKFLAFSSPSAAPYDADGVNIYK